MMLTRLAALGLTGVGLAAAFIPTLAAAGPADDAKIRAARAELVAAMKGKNLDAIMSHYAPDVVVYDAGPPREYVGAAAFRENWRGFLVGLPGPWSVEASEGAVATGGSLGYARTIVHFVCTDAKGAKVEFTDRLTDVYRRIGGKWLIVHEHTSFPVDFETAKADMLSRP
jgi:ketosteroid isomerase-like protein